jgi:hypothetical protein
MADWVVISSLATAGGTLALAGVTLASVRSANRAARVAERSLLVGLRPVLVPARPEDPPQRIDFADGRVLSVPGGAAAVEEGDGTIYVGMPLRNVGAGLAVLRGSLMRPGRASGTEPHAEVDEFRASVRDNYVPAGDTGFWQAAIRVADDPWRQFLQEAIAQRTPITVEVLYGDSEGAQLIISRFVIAPSEGGEWAAAVGRHWNLDG